MAQSALTFRPVVLLTVTASCEHLTELVDSITAQSLPVIVVDQALDPRMRRAFDMLSSKDVTVIHRERPLSRASLFATGYKAAKNAGFTHVLEMNAHKHREFGPALRLLDEAAKNPACVILAREPRQGAHERINNTLANMTALTLSIPSARSDVCVMPVSAFLQLMQRTRLNGSEDFDTDVLIRLVWMGLRVRTVDLALASLPGAAEARLPFNTLKLHTRLLGTMISRFPFIALLRMTGWQPRHWVRSQEGCFTEKNGAKSARRP